MARLVLLIAILLAVAEVAGRGSLHAWAQDAATALLARTSAVEPTPDPTPTATAEPAPTATPSPPTATSTPPPTARETVEVAVELPDRQVSGEYAVAVRVDYAAPSPAGAVVVPPIEQETTFRIGGLEAGAAPLCA